MQTTPNDGYKRASACHADATDGFFHNPKMNEWRRADWSVRVGVFPGMQVSVQTKEFQQGLLQWQRVVLPVLYLHRKATLLLLQGKSLAQILIPGHHVYTPEGPIGPVAHTLVRVDPWEYWLTHPRLTGLVLSNFLHIPVALPVEESLSAVAEDSLSLINQPARTIR